MAAERIEAANESRRGIGVSPGVVMGPVFVLEREAFSVVEITLEADRVEHEICRLEEALIKTRGQIRKVQQDLQARTGMGDASVLDAHLMVLDDRAFIEEVLVGIRDRLKNAEAVVRDVAERYAGVLGSVQDDYLRERVSDVRDVARRIIRNLTGASSSPLSGLTEPRIVVAHDLAPSETAAMRRDLVLGFATDLGSPTSHTAVMARALEIPAIVALRDITHRVNPGDTALIDGNKGMMILRPTPEQLEEYGRVAEVRKNIERGLTSLRGEPAETRDGRRILLSANAEGVDELEAVKQYGAEGVGLFRSEYLWLSRQGSVSEEEQTGVYREVARRCDPDPVIIRTLDVGGDKYLSPEQRWQEANPFLGCRSIRLSLLFPEVFRAQLRAILRASAEGNVKVMFPMISKVAEIEQARALLEEAKRELRVQGAPFREDIEVGAMVEIPAAALCADLLARHVDFFSLGTNDLVQYTLAVDRVNERVAYLYEPTHPAVLKLIRQTIEAGHARDIWVGLCGEMAADPILTPLLVGLGLDELSMAPSAVPLVKDAIRSLSHASCSELAQSVAECSTGEEVLEQCRTLMGAAAPELLELV